MVHVMSQHCLQYAVLLLNPHLYSDSRQRELSLNAGLQTYLVFIKIIWYATNEKFMRCVLNNCRNNACNPQRELPIDSNHCYNNKITPLRYFATYHLNHYQVNS